VFAIAAETDGVAAANGLITVQLAPDQIVAALSLEFYPDLPAHQAELVVADMESRLRAAHPRIFMLFVKPQSSEHYRAARARLTQTDNANPTAAMARSPRLDRSQESE
jgi:divalent metal cation (Fe/Co/Zn/Cd) transporter